VLTPDGASLVYNGLSGDPWTDPASVSRLVKLPLSGGAPEYLAEIGAGRTGDAKLATAMGLSPDGTRIAFVRWDSAVEGAAPTQNLYAMAISGPGSREAVLLDTDVCFQQGRVSWSPDSRIVTYAKAEEPAADDRCDVWAVDAVQPGQPSNVSRRALGHCTVPTFSPVDATIAAICNAVPYATSGGEVVLLDPAGTVEARAAVGAAQGRGNLAWAADGERVAFTHVGGIAALDRRTAELTVLVEPQFVYIRHLSFRPAPAR
jgi:Tol biopolymer transport system component